MRIAIFASGNGTNCQAIMTNAELKKAGLIITCIITDQANAGVIQKAQNNNVPVYYVNPKMFDTKKSMKNISWKIF